MKKLLFIVTFICAVFPSSISAVESLLQLCTEQVAQGLVSDDMLEHFRNTPNFVEKMGLNLELPQKNKDFIKDTILSYRASNGLRLSDWIVTISTISLLGHFKDVYEIGWSPQYDNFLDVGWRFAEIWDRSHLKILSLTQVLFLALVYHYYKPQTEYQSELRLKLDAQNEHLRNIYRTLPEDIKRAIKGHHGHKIGLKRIDCPSL